MKLELKLLTECLFPKHLHANCSRGQTGQSPNLKMHLQHYKLWIQNGSIQEHFVCKCFHLTKLMSNMLQTSGCYKVYGN